MINRLIGTDSLSIAIICREPIPKGGAATNRLKMMAQALVEGGAKVKIFALRVTEYEDDVHNADWKGSLGDVEFEYTPGTSIRPASFLLRRWLQFKGTMAALYKIALLRNRGQLNSIYMFSTQFGDLLPFRLLCKLFKMPLILELCEWSPDIPERSWIRKWLTDHILFDCVDGVLAISHALRDKVLEYRKKTGRNVPVIIVPILVDFNEFSFPNNTSSSEQYFMFSGDLGYRETVTFILKGFNELLPNHPNCKLLMTGPNQPRELQNLKDGNRNLSIPKQVTYLGYVPREDLLRLYRGASALLIPLPSDNRSETRFPTKIAEYCASGKPVVSTSVGEITKYFIDGKNAFLCPPDDLQGFYKKLEYILDHPTEAALVGEAGKETAWQHFHYGVHSQRLINFILNLVHNQ